MAWALSGGQACTPAPPKAQATDPIVIGVSLGLSESLASFSAPLQNAVRVAEGQINAGGGLLGRPVKFDVVDDKSDAKDFVQGVARGFADQNVAAVLGPVGSSQVDAVQSILRAKQILLISPAATSPTLSSVQPARDRYLFRTVPTDNLQASALVQLAIRGPSGFGAPIDAGADASPEGGREPPDGGAPGPGCRSMAIVHADNKYGGPMADVLEKQFPNAAAGRSIAVRIAVSETVVSSYEDVVGTVLAAKPDCLALIQYDDVGGAFMRALDKGRREAPGSLPVGFFVMGTDGTYTPGFLENSRESKTDPGSRNSAEGVVGTNPDTAPLTPEYNEFKDIYLSYFPTKPGDGGVIELPAFIANMFDAAVLVALAIQQAGSATDRVKIRDALYAVSKGGKAYSPSQLSDALQAIRQGADIDYNGASGNVDLDDNGDVVSGFIIWKIENGAFVTKGRVAARDLGP